MIELWTLYGFDILTGACIFALGALVGYSFRPKPKVVQMPDRAPNGKFLPWKAKA